MLPDWLLGGALPPTRSCCHVHDATERDCSSRPVGGQRDTVSSPFNRNGGGRRRADSAGQHDRLANQSLHLGRVVLVDGHSAHSQAENRAGTRTGGGRKDGKKREIEESTIVTLCSTAGTWISCHQGKHKECPQPGEVRECRETEGTSEDPNRRDKDTFIHQTTSPFYQIRREGTHKRHEVRRDRTTDTPNVRKEPLLV